MVFETICVENRDSSIKGFIMNLKTALAASTLLTANAQALDWQEFNSSALIEVKRDDAFFTSSAVVIKRNVILTAAHSVENISEGYIHLSNHYNENNIKIKFKKVVIHSGYNKEESNYKHDIALVILENNLPEAVKPVKFLDHSDISNFQVDRIGFGGRNGKNLRTWTNPKIMDQRENTLVLKDALSVIGDSGGPIYKDNKLVGIHSTLEGIDRTYAVYVPNYINWINSKLPIKQVEI